MSEGRYVFLDFDDTLNDPLRLARLYAQQIGGVMSPRYGREANAWAEAAITMLHVLEDDYLLRFLRNPLAGYNAWLESIRTRSVELLFGVMELPMPENARELMREAQLQALSACDATFPGAMVALQTLKAQGYRVQMASGQESEYLRAALIGAGLDAYLEWRFGPDLIDCAKEGPEYFERIFRTMGLCPAEVVVVEDQPQVIEWALAQGVNVIQAQVSPERRFDTVPGVAAVMTDLHVLPSLVESVFYCKER